MLSGTEWVRYLIPLPDCCSLRLQSRFLCNSLLETSMAPSGGIGAVGRRRAVLYGVRPYLSAGVGVRLCVVEPL